VAVADGGHDAEAAAAQFRLGRYLRGAGDAQPGVQHRGVVGGAGVFRQIDLQMVGVDVRRAAVAFEEAPAPFEVGAAPAALPRVAADLVQEQLGGLADVAVGAAAALQGVGQL
jgi:hypothetical protein